MSISARKFFVASAYVLGIAAITTFSVQAQDVKPQASATPASGLRPLGNAASLVTEFTNNVSSTFSGKVSGAGHVKHDIQFRRTAEGLEAWDGVRNTLLIDPRTYFHFPEAVGTSKLADILEQNVTRSDPQLAPNMSWKLNRTFQNHPESWCSDSKFKVESSFETQAVEKYTLKINGQDTTIDVIPVVEKGFWTKCYSGKRYTRFLVSRDLDAVVSLGFLTYDPRGKLHESSFQLNVVEITQ